MKAVFIVRFDDESDTSNIRIRKPEGIDATDFVFAICDSLVTVAADMLEVPIPEAAGRLSRGFALYTDKKQWDGSVLN